MFKKLFNGYRKKSQQVGKVKWLIVSTIQERAKRFATILQSKSQRVPNSHMKWYLGCFCAIGLTLSLISILASGEPNRSTVTVQQITTTYSKENSVASTTITNPRKFQQAIRMEQYLDSLLRDARMKGAADSFILHHQGLQDSIRLLKSLYLQE